MECGNTMHLKQTSIMGWQMNAHDVRVQIKGVPLYGMANEQVKRASAKGYRFLEQGACPIHRNFS